MKQERGAQLPGGEPGELSCRPLRVLLTAFRQSQGEEALRSALSHLQLPPGVDLTYLEDENHWVSFALGQQLIDALTEASGDPSFPRRAGLQMATREGLGVGYHFLKAFGTPRLCYRRVLEISSVYNRVGSFSLKRLGRTRIAFSYRSSQPEPNRRFCEFRMGQFESFPTIWGLPPARARELHCQARGHESCSYEFEWVNRRFPIASLLGCAVGAVLALLFLPGTGVSWPGWALGLAGGGVGLMLGALAGGIFLVRQRDLLLREQNRDLLRSVQSLQRLNDTLEAKVGERTRELKVAGEKLEEALRRQVALDQAKTHFFTNINHDLRSPLTVVMGGISSILSDPSIAQGTRHRHFLELALRSAARLEAMINDMLELSRIDAGMGRLESSRVDLRELCRGLVQVTEPYARGLKLELRLDAGEHPLFVDGDADKLERVVMNLLFNACKFSRPGTAVTVGVREDGEAALISVTDEGTGIPPEDCERIFDRFYRAPSGESRRVKGTGLGLAVVKEFVELHRGRVWVKSEVGKGSTFFVQLPRTLPAELLTDQRQRPLRQPSSNSPLLVSTTPPPSLLAPPGGPILLVEDDEEVRRYLTSELSRTHALMEASAGEEALELIAARAPQLVLTDVMLPGMDGLEVCRRLREDPRTRELPIVLFSSRGDLQTRLSAFEAGADDFVHKPFDPRELHARIEALLRRRTPRAEA